VYLLPHHEQVFEEELEEELEEDLELEEEGVTYSSFTDELDFLLGVSMKKT
jgi:hypothetical protein